MKRDIKLPFGLNVDGVLVHISEVENGKNCHCYCPSCKSPLIAAKGRQIQHHFKHHIIHECDGGLESAIHLAAKKIIREKKQITLPKCITTALLIDSWGNLYTNEEVVVQDGKIINFDTVQEEKELNGIRADIYATKDNTPLIIEIFYKHKVEDYKIEKIKEAKVSAIEINLSGLKIKNVENWHAFWLFINETNRIKWLHNFKAENYVYPKLISQLEIEIQNEETKYKLREIPILMDALEDLKALRSEERVALNRTQAPTNNAWIIYGKSLNLSIEELPNFLDLDVTDGDWIFGCDRRIWQTAFYVYFVNMLDAKTISSKQVEEIIESICKTPHSPKLVEIYGKRYSKLLSSDLDNLPSRRETLEDYFNKLCKLGMLKFTDNSLQHGNVYKILSKIPQEDKLYPKT